jgi:cytochrome c peroxidase
MLAMKTVAFLCIASVTACQLSSVRERSAPRAWELESPLRPLPSAPRGVNAHWELLPFRLTPEKVRVGRWLFFDKRLSADGTVSCATCHRPENAFSEAVSTSTGIRGQVGARKSPPILNIVWPMYTSFFWDGRASSIVEQAKGPIANPIEMGSSPEQAVTTVAAIPGYRRAFAEAFGDDHVDIERIAEAIAAYEATRLSGDSPLDRYEAGDTEALSPLARRGRELFFGRAGCVACHVGTRFSDGRFHNIGVGWREQTAGRAAGFQDRGRADVTGRPEDLGAFKTPTLRDLTKRGPYMHDGSLLTLREVVQFYERRDRPNPWLAPEMKDVDFGCTDVEPLVAFLESLDGTGYADTAPTHFPE